MALPSGFQRVRWRSKALQKHMAFLLHLPPANHEQSKCYPVPYLLHGSGHTPHSVLAEVCPQEHMSVLGEAMFVISRSAGHRPDVPRLLSTPVAAGSGSFHLAVQQSDQFRRAPGVHIADVLHRERGL